VSAVTGGDGTVSLDAPLGKVQVCVEGVTEEAWIGLDVETEVEIVC
jgi:hypothetical protein